MTKVGDGVFTNQDRDRCINQAVYEAIKDKITAVHELKKEKCIPFAGNHTSSERYSMFLLAAFWSGAIHGVDEAFVSMLSTQLRLVTADPYEGAGIPVEHRNNLINYFVTNAQEEVGVTEQELATWVTERLPQKTKSKRILQLAKLFYYKGRIYGIWYMWHRENRKPIKLRRFDESVVKSKGEKVVPFRKRIQTD